MGYTKGQTELVRPVWVWDNLKMKRVKVRTHQQLEMYQNQAKQIASGAPVYVFGGRVTLDQDVVKALERIHGV